MQEDSMTSTPRAGRAHIYTFARLMTVFAVAIIAYGNISAQELTGSLVGKIVDP